jgi:hypothetical protein
MALIWRDKANPNPAPIQPPIIVGGDEKYWQRPMRIETLDRFSEQVLEYLQKYLGGGPGRQVWLQAQKMPDLRERHRLYMQIVADIEIGLNGNTFESKKIEEFAKWKWQPVGVEEFVCGEYYLNKREEMYPAVLEELKEINSGKYVEIVLTGGIGSAKTTCALYTTAYQLYLLSCMRSPHKSFGQDSSAELLIIFQSINAKLAKNVDFARFRSMLEGCQYFKDKFPFNKGIESKMVFPNRIEVVPVSGAETAAIGQNVIGGVIDELNYMAVVEKSKAAVDKGTYDQAVLLYNSISRRRKSRFLSGGQIPGILCLVSSKKYPGQFTDRKQEEAKTDSTIYVYDKRVWEVKPPGTYTAGWFRVFVGDMTRKPRILTIDEELDDEDEHLILRVPKEYEADFNTDIINALREIGGISTLARHPYFLEVEKVNACFGRHHSIFDTDEVNFVTSKVTLLKGAFWKPEVPRFVHVDLAISGDAAGVAVGCVTDFVSMKDLGRGDNEGMMPNIRIDGVLRVVPPKNSEILFWKIREVLMALRRMGLNIRWVTFDSFQSTDSQQLMRQQGFITGLQSVDVMPCKPYDFLKSAVYDGRLRQPSHATLRKEILMLERDAKTGKIDHPPSGSKDCADAIAGVAYGLTMRREIWGAHHIPLVMIPSSVIETGNKLEDANERHRRNIQEQNDNLLDHERSRARVA